MCRSTMLLLKSIWLRQPKNDSQRHSFISFKELYLDRSGKEISHAKYQQVSEELEDVLPVILWKKGDLQFLFLNAYFRENKIMEFGVH